MKILKPKIMEYLDNGSLPNLSNKTTKLLLNFNGINGSKYTTDVFGNPVTFYGNAQISTSQSKFGGSSLYLDGNGDYISVPANKDFHFGTGDFTIDFRIRFNALPGTGSAGNIYSQYKDDNNYFRLYCGGGNTWAVLIVYGGSVVVAASKAASLSINTWYHVCLIRSGTSLRIFQEGEQCGTDITISDSLQDFSAPIVIGSNNSGAFVNAYIDDFRVVKGEALWTSNFTPPEIEAAIDFNEDFNRFKVLLNQSVTAGTTFSNPIISTYPLVFTGGYPFIGGVLAPNGDIHFIPCNATVGQKISSSGVVSTYSLIYTKTGAYAGGVLNFNGDIHFTPYGSTIGQKVSASGTVSTYSLVYTTSAAYHGGVLAPNGDIHFAPQNATVGQKVSSSGVVSTYSLVYTVAGAYMGATLDTLGNIVFYPYSAAVGQKVSASGVVSTYSLVYTVAGAYRGGVINTKGDIHFVPYNAAVGQKVSASGVVSTYSLVYTTGAAYLGGILAPNGEIHFVPYNATVGQKIDINGIVSTYSLVYTCAENNAGGVLDSNGILYFVPINAAVGQKISFCPAIPFGKGICLSPYFNKL